MDKGGIAWALPSNRSVDAIDLSGKGYSSQDILFLRNKPIDFLYFKMTATPEPSSPVERAKSLIWGRPGTSHTLEDQPLIILHLDPATPGYKPVLKAPSNTCLKVPQQNLDLCRSPLDSIIDRFTSRPEPRPVCSIRKAPKHSTYIYQPPLLPIKEYPRLE